MSPELLYRRWIDELWCGRTGSAAEVVDESFVGHWPDRTVRGVEELTGPIADTHSMLAPLSFSIEIGPFGQGDLVAGRWRGRGRSGDSPVEFIGNDILRVHDGRFVEYWVASATVP